MYKMGLFGYIPHDVIQPIIRYLSGQRFYIHQIIMYGLKNNNNNDDDAISCMPSMSTLRKCFFKVRERDRENEIESTR